MLLCVHLEQTQEIKDLTWAFARIGMRHPKMFRSVAEHLVGKGDDQEMTGRGLSEFNTQGIANLAYSFARHAQLGGEAMDKFGRLSRIPMAGGRLACQFVSFSDVGEGLMRKLFVEIARASMEVHGKFRRRKTFPKNIHFNAFTYHLLLSLSLSLSLRFLVMDNLASSQTI